MLRRIGKFKNKTLERKRACECEEKSGPIKRERVVDDLKGKEEQLRLDSEFE